jgi:hypothetical protein
MTPLLLREPPAYPPYLVETDEDEEDLNDSQTPVRECFRLCLHLEEQDREEK